MKYIQILLNMQGMTDTLFKSLIEVKTLYEQGYETVQTKILQDEHNQNVDAEEHQPQFAPADSTAVRDQLVAQLKEELRESDRFGGREGAARRLGQETDRLAGVKVSVKLQVPEVANEALQHKP